MRSLIYKLFLAAGILASTVGMASSADASISSAPAEITPSHKAQDTNAKFYFSDAVKGSKGLQQYAAYYDHSSHYSHSSHASHYSHVSSRY